jgi:hypothetical protein
MNALQSLALYLLLVVTALIAGTAVRSVADEPEDEIRLDVPDRWRGERIELPPSFARDLKLKGVEKIRFAPGMFEPDAKDFFSYVIVFRLEDQPKLDREVLARELLVYYRGLAQAVSQGKINTEGFTIEVKPEKNSNTNDLQEYVATLDWIEPFATKKAQTLRIEIRAWETPKSRRSWVFMSVSPNKSDDPIWKTMRQVRDKFDRGG